MLVKDIFGILVAVVGLAAFATAVSGKSQTSAVLSSSFNGFGNLIGAATKPVTG